MIVEQTGDDLHLIESADAYPTDFDDVIFVGYLVWASNAPATGCRFRKAKKGRVSLMHPWRLWSE